MTKLIDGKAFAASLRADIAKRVAQLKAKKNITPGLAVVLVGSDPASEVYVKNKAKQTVEAGMRSFEYKLPETTSEAELLAKVVELNSNPDVHGILVQLPLPKHIDETAVIQAIHPDKDVDGFHVINAGRLATGQDGFVPCTPLGCWMLLKDNLSSLAGLHAVVIGRSNIVGKPMAQLLLKESCTVTIAHSKTKDLPTLIKTADIVVAAVGRPKMVMGEWLKQGAVVIDVGINRVDGKLVGDVDFASCQGIAAAITPVPGGVGPMTIACLLENTLKAANNAAGNR
ncbi:MAG: bifunctional methylenetetrahydrofolate dehydrogenase/methenyltetrahydrofolate cyclohydrolase FolD [Rickettsiales bacterium]|jgi:methylenetetrahydrofolate dehydrogenase (NADP+)/methenyltetrahydrofolate cyclohydrolase|nr:bifunctional methylenetetrahydrofolate dehydrogenase/methenyltetrahydrofolate cyclohydrolase FolD [Rickettsiales bacterium]